MSKSKIVRTSLIRRKVLLELKARGFYFPNCPSNKDIAKALFEAGIITEEESLSKRAWKTAKFESTPETEQAKKNIRKNKTFDFYKSGKWRALRYKALSEYGRACMCCGDDKSIAHVDHIKPRSLYPELELDFNNLQVLCEACNLGKSNKDDTDFRPR